MTRQKGASVSSQTTSEHGRLHPTQLSGHPLLRVSLARKMGCYCRYSMPLQLAIFPHTATADYDSMLYPSPEAAHASYHSLQSTAYFEAVYSTST